MTSNAHSHVSATETARDFDAFYEGHFDQAARLAHLLTGSNLVAEDLAQDGLCRMRRRFDDIETGATSALTMTGVCRNWHRGRSREQARLVRIASPVEVALPECERLLELLDALPYRQHAVLVLRYWLDLTEAEIAEVLSCRPGTVKSLCARALMRLRKELGE